MSTSKGNSKLRSKIRCQTQNKGHRHVTNSIAALSIMKVNLAVIIIALVIAKMRPRWAQDWPKMAPKGT